MIKITFLTVAVVLIIIACLNSRKMQNDAGQFFDGSYREFALAIQSNDVAKMSKMRASININHIGREGMSFIFWSLLCKSKTSLEALLNMGADPNIKNTAGETPLAVICAIEDLEYIQILLRHGANPNVFLANGEPAIIFAGMHSSWKNVKLLLDNGANINLADSEGNTIAMIYAGLNAFEEVYQLVKLGADVQQRNKYGANLLTRIQRAIPNPGTPQYEWLQKTKSLITNR